MGTVAFRVVLAREAGPAFTREWTWKQVEAGEYPDWPFSGPPNWLKEPESIWRDPHAAHEFRALVPKGMDHAARELLWPER